MSDPCGDERETNATTDANRGRLVDLLKVALTPGIGPLLHRRLLSHFGTHRAILEAGADRLAQVPKVGRSIAESLRGSAESDEAEALIRWCERFGVTILEDRDPGYPPLLREIHDPPLALFVRGELRGEDRLSVAIVGSRNATPYGKRVAARLGRELAGVGVTVVSGLARGVDAAAHRGALECGGRTIGVLGGGVSNIYPPEHEKLAAEVSESAALVSECPPFSPPRSGSFPRRNRIITGMTLGVVVVEASLRSGALISARHAMEQGREVFAVPGRIETVTARGCHRLIQDGAKLVASVDDVLEELGPLASPAVDSETGAEIRSPAELKLNDVERAVLEKTLDEPTLIDDVIEATRLATPQALAAVSALEMRKLIRRVSGSLIQRVRY